MNNVVQEVQCRIYGRTQNGRNIEIVQNTRVPPGETQMVRLSIGELGEGSYRFEAKGISPMEFQDSTQLSYLSKGYSVFIQTDKAIYRPGNEVLPHIWEWDYCNNRPPQVQFRVIVLSPRLKPSVTGSIGITMSDGAGNLIRDWDRVFTTKVSSSALSSTGSANAMLPGRVGGKPRDLASPRSGKLEYFCRRERTDLHKGVPSGGVCPS